KDRSQRARTIERPDRNRRRNRPYRPQHSAERRHGGGILRSHPVAGQRSLATRTTHGPLPDLDGGKLRSSATGSLIWSAHVIRHEKPAERSAGFLRLRQALVPKATAGLLAGGNR